MGTLPAVATRSFKEVAAAAAGPRMTESPSSRLESCILELHSLSHGADFRNGVLRTLRRLVASPHAIYGFTDLREGATLVGLRYPEQIDLQRWVPVFDAHFWEHPLNGRAGKISMGAVVTMPSLVPATDWARTGNYNEFCRPNGIEHQLMMRLPSPAGVMEAIGLGRHDRDFTDSEHEAFARMKAHVLVAYRRARLLADLAPPLPPELGGWQTAHLVLDDSARVRFVDPGCEDLFAHFFPAQRFAGGKRAPDDLRTWARSQLRMLPATPPTELVRECVVDGRALRLRCWLVPHGAPDGHDVYLQARPVFPDDIIRSETTLRRGQVAATDDLAAQMDRVSARWELTRRQREVLLWLLGGCTNKEIGQRIFSAEVTVEFHVSNLFRRSGATSRTELASRFWNER